MFDPVDSATTPFCIVCVVGARPNFMKMAPIMTALAALGPQVVVKLVHTGQHYDVAMNHQYFEALGIPEPDLNLEVGSGSHAVQTADVMRKFEPALDQFGASAVLVVGDVNSTIACALVATKKGIPVIHVEAGRTISRRVLQATLAAAAVWFVLEKLAGGLIWPGPHP